MQPQKNKINPNLNEKDLSYINNHLELLKKPKLG